MFGKDRYPAKPPSSSTKPATGGNKKSAKVASKQPPEEAKGTSFSSPTFKFSLLTRLDSHKILKYQKGP
jgi:hypothetical protein